MATLATPLLRSCDTTDLRQFNKVAWTATVLLILRSNKYPPKMNMNHEQQTSEHIFTFARKHKKAPVLKINIPFFTVNVISALFQLMVNWWFGFRQDPLLKRIVTLGVPAEAQTTNSPIYFFFTIYWFQRFLMFTPN